MPRLLPLLAISLAALATACAAAPGGSAPSRLPGFLAARGAWEPPTVLEDFDTVDNQYDNLSPVGHPFFEPLEFTPVKPSAGTSTVLEILGANRPRPRKGFLITGDVAEAGALSREVGERTELAEQATLRFRWGVNAVAALDPSLLAEVVLVVESKRLGRKGIGYVWSTRHCPGTVLASQIGAGEGALPLRLIVVAQGVGLGQSCSEAALNKIGLASVERDLAADVRWAYAEGTPLGDLALGALTEPVGCEQARAVPPRQFALDAAGRALPNTDLLGVTALAFGAEVAKGICAQAVVDDVTLQKRWP
ncbi:MAG: hypothetical protein VKQ33_05895 [Candidatus Sericytochromatia bacterium]|nr:hypothetical protein [Candidatus Sericytochromatia bacterium]